MRLKWFEQIIYKQVFIKSFFFLKIVFVSNTLFTGYYWWTWQEVSVPPSNTNIGICFSGDVRVSDALAQCASIKNKLPGKKFISIAGGDEDGRWTLGNITNLNNAIKNKQLAGWDGIVYDIENGETGIFLVFKLNLTFNGPFLDQV